MGGDAPSAASPAYEPPAPGAVASRAEADASNNDDPAAAATTASGPTETGEGAPTGPAEPVLPPQERTITVSIPTEDGSSRTLQVCIVPPVVRKLFLGGFRSKKSGTEYHNASSQTPRRLRPCNTELFHRQTQTAQMSSGVTNQQQTTVASATQMTRPGCFVSSIYDRTLQPRPYESADAREARVLTKIVLLQSYVRRWLAQRFVTQLRSQRVKFMQWKQTEIQRRVNADATHAAATLQRRIKPSTVQDFDFLLQGLQSWRKEQMDLVAQLPEGQRQAALLDLQRQETRYLTSIERLRHIARTENREAAIKSFFDTTAEPRKWLDPKYNKVNSMETTGVRRARELRDLYSGLAMTELTRDERLALLQSIRRVVKEFDTKLTKELLDLLDREENLLTRGLRSDSLEGLRKRISNLFLTFCETPEFNPEAARLLKEHQEFKADVRLCSACGRFLSLKDFDPSPTAHSMGRCRRCAHTHATGSTRVDPAPFAVMLKQIQERESRTTLPSRLCFALTPNDVQTIVEQVWGGRSALSQHAELHHLTLARWDCDEPWAPWNVVLLTDGEAAAHARLADPAAVYAPDLVRRVNQRCAQARVLFRRLADESPVFAMPS